MKGGQCGWNWSVRGRHMMRSWMKPRARSCKGLQGLLRVSNSIVVSEPMKGFKRKRDTVCLEFRKMPLAAACSFEKKRDQGGGWNKMRGERRRGLNAWEMDPRETLNPWCGDQMRVWTVLVTCEPSPPGLLRFSDSVLKTPYLSNTKGLLVSLYIFTIPDLTMPCISPF